MNLQPKFFDFVKNGTKCVELRLYDEKRQLIELGDMIEFSKSPEERIRARVMGLLRYRTFEDLVADFDIALLADNSMTKGELLDALAGFYPLEKQKQFGVMGIRIELSR